MKKVTTYFLSLFFSLIAITNYAAPAKEYWNQWVAFDPFSKDTISYSAWQNFLNKYAVKQNGQIYIKYAVVSTEDKSNLNKAIQQLSQLPINQYNRNEQLAFWINLYNMETVYLVLQHYPITSITDIKSGLFSFGPWDKPLLKVDGIELTLNDIEHRIIRPIWNDPRIHAAVNCASISCPNLMTVPFTGININHQLNIAFEAFVNSSKGLQIKGNTLVLSEIFKWYGVDFGNNKQDIKNFVSYYIQSHKNKQAVLDAKHIRYQSYNWDLNGIK